jgi:hypothetical protein
MEKIKRLSLMVKCGLIFTCCSLLFSMAVGLFLPDGQLQLGKEGGMHIWVGLEVTGQWLDLATRLHLAGFNERWLLGLPQLLPLLCINLLLLRLFGLYQRGQIFTRANIKCFAHIGWTLVAYFLLNLLYPPLLITVLNELPGAPALPRSISLQDTDILILLSGLILTVIAQVMSQGAAMQAEQELTI